MRTQTVILRLNGTECSTEHEKLRAATPVVVVIKGDGVITKRYAAGDQAMKRITENEELLWSERSMESGGVEVSFVRKENVHDAMVEIKDIVQVCVGEQCERISFTVRRLMAADDAANVVLSCITRRIKLPLLISVLVVLAVNFFVSSELQSRNSIAQARLSQQRHSVESRQRESAGSQRLSEQMRRNEYRHTIITDRISANVPDRVILSVIDVNPIVKRPETGMLIELKHDVFTIRGEANRADDVAEFYNRLLNSDMFQEVKINTILSKDGVTGFEMEGRI